MLSPRTWALAVTATLALGALTATLPASAGSTTYDYDAAGRLTRVDFGNGRSIDYAYDANGNLLARVVTGGSPVPVAPSITLDRAGSQVRIDYPTGACNATDHALFVGALGNFDTVTAATCSLGNDGSAVVSLPAGSVWLLLAGIEGTAHSGVGTAAGGPRVPTGIGSVCPGLSPDPAGSCALGSD